MTGSGNLRKRAQSGDVDAMYDLGTEYEAKGDHRRAREWYGKAAEAGDAASVRALGVLEHFHGAGADAARPYYERAAGLGDGQAMNNLGLMLYEAGDREQGRELLRSAAAAGYTDALFNVGIIAKGEGDNDEAREWLQRAADAGVAKAWWGLGVIALSEDDSKTARRCAETAADQGCVDGMALVAELHEEAGELVRAKAWYAKAAEHGNSDALFRLGLLEQRAGNLADARAWYERAVDAGCDDALSNLGLVLGDLGDLEGARGCFEEVARAGHHEGLVNLGVLLHREGDDEGARGAYERAAELGSTDAMTNLGLMASAAGDAAAAEDWWQRAAALGDMNALFQLGLLERRERKVRRGVPRRPAEKKGLSLFITPGPLDGYVFVFTGGLESMTRKQAERTVREHGGRVSSHVTDDTSFVVVGGSAGVKALMGEMSDAYLIDEETFVRILDEGVGAVYPVPPTADEPTDHAETENLAGRSFVLTGRLASMTRDEAAEAIRARGGRVSTSVSKGTSYLVAGEDPGAKLSKAEALGVAVLDEAAFQALLDG